MDSKKRKFIRVLGYLGIFLLILLAGTTIAFNLLYKSYIIKHTDGWVAKASDSVYHASIQDVSINVFTKRVLITGLKVWADTTNANYKKATRKSFKINVGGTINELELDDVQLIKLWRQKVVSFGNVYIREPKVVIERTYAIADNNAPEHTKAPSIKGLTAENIYIQRPDITYRTYDKELDVATCKLSGGDATLADWRLDSTMKDTTRFLLARSCIINCNAFSFYQPSMLYIFKTDAFYTNTADKHLRLTNVTIEPPMDNVTFYKRLGHRTTVCRFHGPLVDIAGFDWTGVLHNKTIAASKAVFDAPRLALYFNYLIPSHPGNMLEQDPHMLLLKAGMHINVPEINIHTANIKYTELNEDTKREGTIYFDHVEGHITNLTNIQSVIARHPDLAVTASGLVLGKSAMSASMKISLTDSMGRFAITGDASDVYAAEVRQPIRIMAEIEIDSLQIHKIHVHISGNRDTSRSVLDVRYNDLKAKLLRVRADDSIVRMPVVSFVANTFFVFSDNPMHGKDLRVTTTFLRRDVTWPYFGTILKNIKLGAKHTVTRDPKLVDAITKTLSKKKQVLKSIENLFRKKKNRK